MKEKEITDFFNQQSTSNWVFVEIYSTWCPHCKMIRPLLEELEEAYSTVQFIYYNMDTIPGFPKKYEIESVPTLFLFHDHSLIWHHSGFLSYEELDELLRANVALKD